ncbi:imidazole glycerol phosphate synthase subunit HisH [Oribacterium sp. C9]|uniref:imidazole glycerol phosphate synthase subunit HisH n=1 Tax=Oribacterium sp. C9 TaxID=1943579 RepID=UPI00098F60FD|nr:imidazole glycerol phosphate synthase subunit HisH [Oribacterium sp. C9]OON87376.1 imidazole glycerol phosphate synthase subunit HisH [Oribacterium sp. C9]
MIAIIDYGVGNLFSLKSSIASIGAEAVVTSEKEIIDKADHVILPGVGAFGDAVSKLRDKDLFYFVKEQAATGKPFLGICLGMQLLFDKSYEYGEHEGLGLVPGVVRPLEGDIPENLDIPHMGWNSLHFIERLGLSKDKCDAFGAPTGRSPIFRNLNEGDHVYFVHSFAAFECVRNLTATAEYGFPLTAAVQNNNVYGTQFHPEKSGEVGMKILKAFAEL